MASDPSEIVNFRVAFRFMQVYPKHKAVAVRQQSCRPPWRLCEVLLIPIKLFAAITIAVSDAIRGGSSYFSI